MLIVKIGVPEKPFSPPFKKKTPRDDRWLQCDHLELGFWDAKHHPIFVWSRHHFCSLRLWPHGASCLNLAKHFTPLFQQCWLAKKMSITLGRSAMLGSTTFWSSRLKIVKCRFQPSPLRASVFGFQGASRNEPICFSLDVHPPLSYEEKKTIGVAYPLNIGKNVPWVYL